MCSCWDVPILETHMTKRKVQELLFELNVYNATVVVIVVVVVDYLA